VKVALIFVHYVVCVHDDTKILSELLHEPYHFVTLLTEAVTSML